MFEIYCTISGITLGWTRDFESIHGKFIRLMPKDGNWYGTGWRWVEIR